MAGIGRTDAFRAKDGRGALIIDKLPNSMFINANKVIELCQMLIITGKQRRDLEAGAPDVIIKDTLGNQTVITKRQLIEEFTHIDGSRIVMAYVRGNKWYTVMKSCNIPYRVIKIPRNCMALCNGKKVRSGCYIVGLTGANGKVDRGTLMPMSVKRFRQTFVIPRQAIIEKHMNNSNATDQFDFSRARSRIDSAIAAYNNGTYKPQPNRRDRALGGNTGFMGNTNSAMPMSSGISESNGLGANVSFGNIQNRPQQQGHTVPVQVRTQGQNQGQTQGQRPMFAVNNGLQGGKQQGAQIHGNPESNYRYVLVARAVNEVNNKLEGYIIKELNGNRQRFLATDKIMELCKNKLVSNAYYVTNQRGTGGFLRGNGITLENLPQTFIQRGGL